MKRVILLILTAVLVKTNAQTPIDTDFTYQGELIFNDQLATGDYDFEVTAFDAITNGTDYDSPLSIDAIPVVNGIFTLPLNFGDTPFMGNEVFLEIGVRLNGSGLPYESLSPRQKLTSSPYAIHAQFVGANAVTNSEIQDGAIITQDLADNSVTAAKLAGNAVDTEALQDGAVAGAKIAANTVGIVAVNNTQIQTRVTGSCTVGQYISTINQDGTVVCNVDDTGTTIVTSAEIVNGTIATIDLADDIITSDKIMNGSIGSSKIISSQVQRRVSSSCDNGYYLVGINQDGSVQCKLIELGDDHLVDTSQSLSPFISIIIREDTGMPIIANANNGLEAYDCTNEICTSGTPRSLDSTSSSSNGLFNSIAIKDIISFPIISYYKGFLSRDLLIYSCEDNNCSTGTKRTLDSTGDVGRFTSMKFINTGNPIISYYDSTNSSLKVYNCNDSQCSSGFVRTIDNSADVGSYSSLAVRQASGKPVISYYDLTSGDLKIFDCSNINCTVGIILAVDTINDVGRYTSIAIREPSGLPVVSYYDVTNQNLKLYDCSTQNCSSGTVRTLDSSTAVGKYSSIALGYYTGYPIISYYDEQNKDLKIYDCHDVTCSTGTARTLDHIRAVGKYSSIAIRQSGLPIISYFDDDLNRIKVYTCGDTRCTK